jgi:hypothetical protein
LQRSRVMTATAVSTRDMTSPPVPKLSRTDVRFRDAGGKMAASNGGSHRIVLGFLWDG